MTKLQILHAQSLNFSMFQYLGHKIFCLSKIKSVLHVLYVNTNIAMQYDEPVLQGKSTSTLKAVTLPWINVSGYNFNVMKALHGFAVNPTQC